MTRNRKRRVLVCMSAVAFALCFVAQDAKSDTGTIEQHWDLLFQPRDGMTGGVPSYSLAGVLPGGTSGFDPQPTVTFEVAGKTTGTTGNAKWKVQLREGPGNVLAEVSFGASDSSLSIKTASFSWPSSDRGLVDLLVQEDVPLGSLKGTFDFKKAYLKIRQSGTIKKTVARFPLASKQTVNATSFQDVADPVVYKHAVADLRPAPTVRLRVGKYVSGATEAEVRLVDGSGTPVSGSTIDAYNCPEDDGWSCESGDLTLTEGTQYRLQARRGSASGFTLVSASLVFRQSTADANGLHKVVAFFPSLSSPKEFSTSGTNLDVPFNAPSRSTLSESLKWIVTMKRTSGSGDVALDLYDRTDGDLATFGSVSSSTYAYGEWNVMTSVPAGNDYDSRSWLSATATGARASGSVLRMTLGLRDTTPPNRPQPSSVSPASPANNNGPKIIGVAESGSTVRLYTNSSCSSAVAASGTAATFASPGLSVSVADNTSTTFWATATDADDNTSLCSTSSVTYVEDSVAPVAPTVSSSSPVSPANNNSPKILGSAEAGSTVKLYTNGTCSSAVAASGSAATFASPGLAVSVADNSSTTFWASATDAAGNVSACSSSSVPYVEDSTAPETTIDTGPSGPVSSTSATFTFSAGESSTFQCSLDGAAFAACTSPKGYTGLAQGSHTVEVKATDTAGNVDASPASRTWTVDTVAPVAPTVSVVSPASPANNNSPKVIGSAEAGSTVRLYTNGSCSSAVAASGLAATFASPGLTVGVADNTSTTFWTTATDAAGNASACSSSSVTYVEDSAAPAAPTVSSSSPASPANNNGPKIIGSAEEGSTVRLYTNSACSSAVAASGWAATFASPGLTVSVADNTSMTFWATATDAAGNASACSTSSVPYVEDSAAPNTTIDSGPSGATPSTGATFTFSAGEPSTFQCSLDGGAFASCSSPKSYTGLAQGSHTFEVKATDTAGNADVSPASRTWTVDTIVPAAPFVTSVSPASPANNNSPKVIGSAESGSTVKAYTNGTCSSAVAGSDAAAAFASAGILVNVADNTTTTFWATATDSAGNVSACSSSSVTYVEDSAAPETTIDSGPSGAVSSTSASFTFSANESSTFQCSLDGAAFSACTSPKSYSALAQGSHTFEVKATDAAGNPDASPASRTWTVDTVAPDTSITAGPSGAVSSTSASFAFSSTEPGVSFLCALDAAAFAACVSPKDYSELAQGSHTFQVKAVDAAGNVDATPASRTWTVDTVAPAAPAVSSVSPGSPANNNEPKIIGTAESGSSVLLFMDGACTAGIVFNGPGSAATFASPGVTIRVDDNTSTTFWATATDAAGNTSACSTTSVTYVEDSAAPVISGLAASPNPFSPNGDGHKDTTTISAQIADATAVTWTVQVWDLSTKKYEESGAGPDVSVTWGGEGVSKGYQTKLLVDDAAGNHGEADGAASADIDPPDFASTGGTSFSPLNFNPSTAATTFTSDFSDGSPPFAWTLRIKNQAANVKRTFTGSATASDVAQSWDGKDEAGVQVPDGAYTGEITVTDAQNLTGTHSSSTVGVDTVAPVVSNASASPDVFAPGGDDDATTTVSASANEPSFWTAIIYNQAGQRVRGLLSVSGSFSYSMSWNGTDDSWETVVPDGVYEVRFTARDPANNSSTASTNVVVDNTVPVISSYTASPNPFSPGGNGPNTTTTFRANFSEPVSWELNVRNAAGVTVQVFMSAANSSFEQVWDGKDAVGLVVPDGTYRARLIVNDATSHYSEQTIYVVVDSSPVGHLGFEARPNPFAPEAPTPRDETTISAKLSEARAWTLTLSNAETGEVIRTVTGSTTDVSLQWDGRRTNGTRAPDGAYKAVLSTTDSAGNVTNAEAWMILGPAPTITSITPNPARMYRLVTVQGTNFGSGVGMHGVTVAGQPAQVKSWSPTSIQFFLPPGLDPGPVDVRVWEGGLTSMGATLTIDKANAPPADVATVEGRIQVRLRPAAVAGTVASRHGDSASALTPIFPGSPSPVLARWYALSVPVGQERAKVAAYATDADVEVAEVEPQMSGSTTDPLWGGQWALKQLPGVEAERAWSVTLGSEAVSIAVLDEDLLYHPDLEDKVLSREAFGGNGSSCYTKRNFSHGTATAGMAAALTDNGIGVAGLDKRVRIRAYTLTDDASCKYQGQFAGALVAACQLMDVKVVNVSMNFDEGVSVDDPVGASRLVDEVLSDPNVCSGVPVVVSAGNHNQWGADYPASYPGAIGVGAVEYRGHKATFSNYGSDVALYAPGDQVWGLRTTKASDGSWVYDYARHDGTSFAAPYVSATLSLLAARGVSGQDAVDAVMAGASRVWWDRSYKRTTDPDQRVQDVRVLNAGNALLRRAPKYPPGTWIVAEPDPEHPFPGYWFIDGPSGSSAFRRFATSQVAASWGVSPADAVQLPITQIKNDYTKGAPMGFRPGSLVIPAGASADQLIGDATTYPGDVHVITNDGGDWTRGQRKVLGTGVAACGGYHQMPWPASAEEFNVHPGGGTWGPALGDLSDPISYCTKYPNGTILSGASGTFMLEGSVKRPILDALVLKSWGAAQDVIVPATSPDFGRDPGPLLGFRPGSVIEYGADHWFISSEGDFGLAYRRRFGSSSGTGEGSQSPWDAWHDCFGAFSRQAVIAPDNPVVLNEHHVSEELRCQ